LQKFGSGCCRVQTPQKYKVSDYTAIIRELIKILQDKYEYYTSA
jgi:hypothetical protein